MENSTIGFVPSAGSIKSPILVERVPEDELKTKYPWMKLLRNILLAILVILFSRLVIEND